MPSQRNVLVLSRLGPRERGEELAQAFHRIFTQAGHRSAILSYVDLQHALEIIGGVRRFDACVVQPRLSPLPLQLLASLRQRSQCVVIEGYSIVGVDVDQVAANWPRAVEIAMRHVLDLGHRRIGFVTQASPVRAFAETARWFRAYHRWAGLSADMDPVILVGPGGEGELFNELYGKLHAGEGRLPFSALIVHPGIFHGENLLAGLGQRGVAVPDQLSLVLLGVTNMGYEHVDRLAMAGCSTEQIAAAVAATIERRWASPAEPYKDDYLEPELIVRSSTRAIAEV
jgi:DNA-binding LacI/PurR family transcriptional regulator